ncbi:caspase family protein [Longispora sp. K20-0274]|uniref:caspase family protein n=1 Tax=Longispora sp. K20-0274 TaxID=3088255 RepID=UPI00399C408C
MARRALIIANGLYDDPRFRPLPGAEADLYGLRAVLADPLIGGFEVEVVRNGSTDDTRVAIQQFFASAGREDVLLLHVSAHGRRDETRWYFAASNTRHDYLDATGIPFEFIDQRIDRGLSRRVVVLLDCCYSGAATLRRTRGEPVVDLSDQFNGRGRVVITSSTALQYAHEQEVTSATPARPSVFTQAVITGLATGAADLDGDGYVSVDELYDYVHAEVTSRIPEQTPTRTADQVEGRLLLTRTPAARRATPADPHRTTVGETPVDGLTTPPGGPPAVTDPPGGSAAVADPSVGSPDTAPNVPSGAARAGIIVERPAGLVPEPGPHPSDLSAQAREPEPVPSDPPAPARDPESVPMVPPAQAGEPDPVLPDPSAQASESDSHPSTPPAQDGEPDPVLPDPPAQARDPRPRRTEPTRADPTGAGAEQRREPLPGGRRRPATPVHDTLVLPATGPGSGRALTGQFLSGLAYGALYLAILLIQLNVYGFPRVTIVSVAAGAGLVGHLAFRGRFLAWLTVHRGPVLLGAAAQTGVLLLTGPDKIWAMCAELLLVGLLAALRPPVTAAAFRPAGPGAHSLALLGLVLGAVAAAFWAPSAQLVTVAVVACGLYAVVAGLTFTPAPPPRISGPRLPTRSHALILLAATAELTWAATLLLTRFYRDTPALVLVPGTDGSISIVDTVAIMLLMAGAALGATLVVSRIARRGHRERLAALAVLGLLGQGGYLYGAAKVAPMAADLLLLPALTLCAALTVGAVAYALPGRGPREHEQFRLARALGLAGGLSLLPVLYPEIVSYSAEEEIREALVAITLEAGSVVLVAVVAGCALWLARRPGRASWSGR